MFDGQRLTRVKMEKLCNAGWHHLDSARPCGNSLCWLRPRASLFENSAAAAEQATILGDTFGSFVFRDERGNAARPHHGLVLPASTARSVDADRVSHARQLAHGRQARDIGEQDARSTASCSRQNSRKNIIPADGCTTSAT